MITSLLIKCKLFYALISKFAKLAGGLKAMDDWIGCRDIWVTADRDQADLLPLHLAIIGFLPIPLGIEKGAPAV
jgi:hypothetical protein